MLDPAIQSFFDERKEGWLKKHLKESMPEEEKQAKQQACEQEFSLDNWLPNAAKRAGQMSIATHPCTFSHPSARKNKNGYVTPVIAKAQRQPDGLLKTGNVQVPDDALGNAAALDVYKFLSIKVQDKTLVEHIQQETELAQNLLAINTASYQNLRDGFLAMADTSDQAITSSKIKQVYFPVDDSYHLLSILSHSGMIYELRNRVDALRFSDQVKEGREKRRKKEYMENGYSEIYNITTIGYGGTKPQNVSVLNNQYGGKAHLLLSAPPMLQKREIRFPSKDFFKQSIRFYDADKALLRLHKALKIEKDSVISSENARTAVENGLQDIFDEILQRMAALRRVSRQQFYEPNSELPGYQKIWLCEQFAEQRQQQTDWLDQLTEEIARWVVAAYKKVIKKHFNLGAAELKRIKNFVADHAEVLQ
jgi:CRISPR-associated protein Csy1